MAVTTAATKTEERWGKSKVLYVVPGAGGAVGSGSNKYNSRQRNEAFYAASWTKMDGLCGVLVGVVWECACNVRYNTVKSKVIYPPGTRFWLDWPQGWNAVWNDEKLYWYTNTRGRAVGGESTAVAARLAAATWWCIGRWAAATW